MEKAVVKEDFDKRPLDEVTSISRRKLKKLRMIERDKTSGKKWYQMPATELTDENRRDLELIQMRDALDSKTHYRKPEREVLPKYYQIGRIVEDKADFYSARLTKKQRKRTLVEELMADHELIARNKRRYNEIMAKKMQTRKGAFSHRRLLSKRSKRKNKKRSH